jgi:rhodanese-related sulfurtransferase
LVATIGRMAGDPRVQPIDAQVRLARAVVENLRPADLAEELRDRDVVLVDVREPDELGSGTIGGAISVPRGVVEFVADPLDPWHRAGLDPARRVVVICDTGARSALVVQALYSLGYCDAAHLDGGLVAWVADGRALVPQSVVG